MNQERDIEQYAEATATVVGKLISGVLRIVYAVFYGIIRGLCLLPLFRGFRKAIIAELNKPRNTDN